MVIQNQVSVSSVASFSLACRQPRFLVGSVDTSRKASLEHEIQVRICLYVRIMYTVEPLSIIDTLRLEA